MHMILCVDFVRILFYWLQICNVTLEVQVLVILDNGALPNSWKARFI